MHKRHITATFCLDDLSAEQHRIAMDAFNRLGETCHFGCLIKSAWADQDEPAEEKSMDQETVPEDTTSQDPDTVGIVVLVPSKLGRLLHFLAEEDGQDLDEYLTDIIRHYATAQTTALIELPDDQG